MFGTVCVPCRLCRVDSFAHELGTIWDREVFVMCVEHSPKAGLAEGGRICAGALGPQVAHYLCG